MSEMILSFSPGIRTVLTTRRASTVTGQAAKRAKYEGGKCKLKNRQARNYKNSGQKILK